MERVRWGSASREGGVREFGWGHVVVLRDGIDSGDDHLNGCLLLTPSADPSRFPDPGRHTRKPSDLLKFSIRGTKKKHVSFATLRHGPLH